VIEAGRRALVLAPHTDDGEFGCGGTIARLVEAGAEVHYMAFSTASRSLPEGFPADTLAREVRAATSSLGIPTERLVVHEFEVRTFPSVRQEILELLVSANSALRPDLVLMPSLGDIHQDHETVAREGMRAFKRTTLLGYEIPWNCFSFHQQAYVTLEPRHLDAKVAALRCYDSQKHRNYANEEYIRNIARTRGIESGRELAEVFEVYRWVL
jgi:N-acetylglucosamine malate deacetylase 1